MRRLKRGGVAWGAKQRVKAFPDRMRSLFWFSSICNPVPNSLELLKLGWRYGVLSCLMLSLMALATYLLSPASDGLEADGLMDSVLFRKIGVLRGL